MPINVAKLREEAPDENSQGFDITEQWEIYHDDDAGGYNQNGYVDPNTALEHPGLPAVGTPNVNFPAALCYRRRVIQVVANWSVIAMVFYRSYGLYSGGPRSRVRSYGAALETVVVPVYRRYLDQAAATYWLDTRFPWQREHTLRTETRFLTGNQVDVVQSAVAKNVGNYYQVGGNLYLLSGQTNAEYVYGSFYTRVEYAFESWAGYPQINAGDSIFKNSIQIPRLGNLDKWSHGIDPATGAPFIVVAPRASFSLQGTALPGL